MTEDTYAWLEEIDSAQSMAWVQAQNARTEAEIASSGLFRQIKSDIRAILDSDARIPGVQKIGDLYYNFWKDREHERGIWRRTTLDEYRKDHPRWGTVLDLDTLNEAEGENWVWQGADALKPDCTRCLIDLSRGGADANVTREFDLAAKEWVEDGFYRPESKGGLGWIDRDTVYVYTDFGDDSMTRSGYPRIVKQWTRGTPMSAAKVVYEGQADDLYIVAFHDDTPGHERDFVSRSLAFYQSELYLRTKAADGADELIRIDVPVSANAGVHRQWLLVELREPWEVDGKDYAAGSLLATDFDKFMACARDVEVLFEPTASTSLAGFTATRNHVLLNVLDDVKSRLSVLTPTTSGWTRGEFEGAPDFGSLGVAAVDSDHSDAVWLTSTDYLTPTTLSLADIGSTPEPLKTMPAYFDASGHVIEQHFAVSPDGTRVPYFLVRPKDLTGMAERQRCCTATAVSRFR